MPYGADPVRDVEATSQIFSLAERSPFGLLLMLACSISMLSLYDSLAPIGLHPRKPLNMCGIGEERDALQDLFKLSYMCIADFENGQMAAEVCTERSVSRDREVSKSTLSVEGPGR